MELGAYLGTNCPQVEMIGQNGLKRKVLAGNTKAVLCLIKSIPSKKAEPNQNLLDSFSFILLVSKMFVLKPVLFLSFSLGR